VTPLPTKGILANTMKLRELGNTVGFSTNGHLVIDWAIENRVTYDKVLMFTDEQMWDSQYGRKSAIQDSWHKYKLLHPQAKLYLFDLSGNSTSRTSSILWTVRISSIL